MEGTGRWMEMGFREGQGIWFDDLDVLFFSGRMNEATKRASSSNLYCFCAVHE